MENKKACLILTEPKLNDRLIYNAIYGNLRENDAVIVSFVGNEETNFDYWCSAYKYFYNEENIHFVGVKGNILSVDDNLIDEIINVIQNSKNISLGGYEISDIFAPEYEQLSI